jgi:beta-galactosidase
MRLRAFGFHAIKACALPAAVCALALFRPGKISTVDAVEPARTMLDFDRDWLFSRGDFATAALPAFDDSTWRRVNVPHDWSIEGPFGPEHSSGNGYAPGGVGWYRKHFRLDAGLSGRNAAIEFDGVYNNAEVWINGFLVGGRPYGYSSFECILDPHLKFGGEDNVVAVRVDHSRFADSRWYTGSGIYRHVRLRFTGRVHLGRWGTSISTPRISAESALVRVETTIENQSDQSGEFDLLSEVVAPDERVAARQSAAVTLNSGAGRTVTQQFEVARPRIWSVESPALYTLRNRLTQEATAADESTTPFGIRSIRFDAATGLFLNERAVKLKGVCLHHDAGCLGAAVPEGVWARRLRMLKGLGVNAIRTSHNPPAPEFLDLCDQLGFLVQDEAFDELTPPKNKWVSGWNIGVPSRFGHGEIFAEWSGRDIRDMVRRDRSHPSIIMWSVGNEVDYPNDPFSHAVLGDQYRPQNPPAENLVKYAKPLIETVKELDPTRPVTAALASVAMSDAVGLAELLDIVGYNYQEARYPADHRKYPRRVIYGSENGHQFGNWSVVRDSDYVLGQFLWTGIDYLGEARAWPNRANGAGLLDLAGFRKPAAWFRESLWSDKPMVYICASLGAAAGGGSRRGPGGEERWNWPPGAPISIRCYSNCPAVQLTLNDRTIGVKQLAEAVDGVLSWTVPFAPGILRAIGLKDGRQVSEFALQTAEAASEIRLLPDETQLRADGKDVSHVEFQIVDSRGVRIPDAGQELTFEIQGPARILGIGNGDLNNSEEVKGRSHRAFQGRGLLILQTEPAAGRITLKATAPGLKPATVFLTSR